MAANHAETSDARRLLFAGLVDYAGLFPPAALPMADAVASYDEYRRSDNAWALGKFVLGVARIAEFAAVARPVIGRGEPWSLALVAGADFSEDIRTIGRYEWRADPNATVGAIEVKAATPDAIATIAKGTALLRTFLPDAFDTYVEVPIADDPSALLESIAAHGLRAKVRTGGVEAGAFPPSENVARFLTACVRYGVTFKATAGLHHAIRGDYPLTYDAASARGTMFGFLNVFLAALFARDGLDSSGVRAMLDERDVRNFIFNTSGVEWRDRRVTAEAIRAARGDAATSFGSCSFGEPIAELSSLGLL